MREEHAFLTPVCPASCGKAHKFSMVRHERNLQPVNPFQRSIQAIAKNKA
jgi:hypothetical protein